MRRRWNQLLTWQHPVCRSSACAITWRAFASFASIWSLKMLSYASIWTSLSLSLSFSAHVYVHIQHRRWSDRRCLSRCALHGSGMPLVEEDHVHCVNRDNSDLIGLQADSLCILIGWAPDVSLSPSWSQPWQQVGNSQSEPGDMTTIIKIHCRILDGFWEALHFYLTSESRCIFSIRALFFAWKRTWVTWMLENVFISNWKNWHFGHVENLSLVSAASINLNGCTRVTAPLDGSNIP